MAVIDSAELLLQAKNYSGSGDWLDESGNGHDATPQGSPTFNGDHFTLNGTSQYFTITDDANLDFGNTDDFTVMCVFRGRATTNENLVAKASISTAAGYQLHLNASDTVTARIRDATTTAQDFSPSIPDDLVHIGALVRNVTDDDVEAFLDGTGSGSPASDGTTASLANGNTLNIGASPTPSQYYGGDIFAVAVWRSALSDGDVATAGQELLGIFPDTPINLSATAVSASQINLSWEAVFGANGYDIERGAVVIVSDQAATTYNDTGLDPNTEYDYRVRAVS